MSRATEWEVILSPGAIKQLSRMTPPDRERIMNALDALVRGPYRADVARLHGRPEWRLRVGGWRVLLRVDLSARAIVATYVGSRGDVYKD